MNEKQVYLNLLDGILLEFLLNETQLVNYYRICDFKIENIRDLQSFIISNFGDLLEEEEEEILNSYLLNNDSKKIKEFYETCLVKYRKLIREKLAKFIKIRDEILFESMSEKSLQEITNRFQELLFTFEKTADTYKFIRKNYFSAIAVFEKETRHNCLFVAKRYSQDDEFAEEVYFDAFNSFLSKLKLRPNERGFFRFEKIESNKQRANLYTFFQNIYRNKLIDAIRKNSRNWINLNFIEKISSNGEFESIPDIQENGIYEGSNNLKVKEGMKKLRPLCQEILELKWFGSEELSNKEIALQLNKAPGTIDNNSMICKEELIKKIEETVSFSDYIGEYKVTHNSTSRIVYFKYELDKVEMVFDQKIKELELIINDVFLDTDGFIYRFQRNKDRISGFEIELREKIVKGIKMS